MKTMRYRIGTTADPHTAWLLGRASRPMPSGSSVRPPPPQVARFLAAHPKVAGVRYLGLIDDDDPEPTWPNGSGRRPAP